jgi:hypothetical protein
MHTLGSWTHSVLPAKQRENENKKQNCKSPEIGRYSWRGAFEHQSGALGLFLVEIEWGPKQRIKFKAGFASARQTDRQNDKKTKRDVETQTNWRVVTRFARPVPSDPRPVSRRTLSFICQSLYFSLSLSLSLSVSLSLSLLSLSLSLSGRMDNPVETGMC